MRAVPGGQQHELVCAYVAEQAGVQFDPAMCASFAILNSGNDFVGGVVISDFRGYDCQISTATETSIAWQDTVIRAVFSYVFDTLGCIRCTSLTKKGNKRCRAFLEGLGFTLEGNLRMGYDGIKDALIYGLLASECRYLEGYVDGQVIAESTDSTGPLRDSAGPRPDEQGDGGSERQPEPYKPVHSRGLFDVQPDRH